MLQRKQRKKKALFVWLLNLECKFIAIGNYLFVYQTCTQDAKYWVFTFANSFSLCFFFLLKLNEFSRQETVRKREKNFNFESWIQSQNQSTVLLLKWIFLFINVNCILLWYTPFRPQTMLNQQQNTYLKWTTVNCICLLGFENKEEKKPKQK